MAWTADHLGAVLGIVTFLGGLLAWYRASVEKTYAAQRDFSHVKESLRSLTTNLNSMKDWEDARFDGINDKLNDIRAMLSGMQGGGYNLPGRRNDRDG